MPRSLEFSPTFEGYTTNAGGTIPSEVLVTNEKPDLVMIDEQEKIIKIVELTVPWEERLEESRRLKSNKYAPLVSDLTRTGYKIEFIPLEVGVRGIINKENQTSIHKITKLCEQKTTAKYLRDIISKTAVSTSYFIFLSRDESEWNAS